MVTEAASPPALGIESRRPALSLRRLFLVAAPVLAGLFAIVGAVADPGAGEDGRVMYEQYAANPDPLQWKSFSLHWSYAFWTMTAFVLAAQVRARGVWLASAALVVAFVGATTLPGLLFVDFYDSAIGQAAGVDTTVRVREQMEEMWAVQAMAVPGVAGFVLSLPLAVLAAWRGGILRWWAVAAALGGVAAFGVSGFAVWGTTLTAVLFAVFAYGLSKSEQLAG